MFMRKLLTTLSLIVATFFTSCTSPMFDKTAKAYDEATKELSKATSESEAKGIHDKLMTQLYAIAKEYPDWKDIVEKEDKDSKALKEVSDAYDTWNNTFCESAKDDEYLFMALCNFPNAIEQSEGKNPEEQEISFDELVPKEKPFPLPSKSNIIEDFLENYEELASKYISSHQLLKDLNEFSDLYNEEFEKLQKLKRKVNALAYNCNGIAPLFNAAQQARYEQINKNLKKTKE